MEPTEVPRTRIFFEITDKGELARVVAQGAGSVETEFSFKEWGFNPTMADALFHFSLPPGVVIVDGLLPSSPAPVSNRVGGATVESCW